MCAVNYVYFLKKRLACQALGDFISFPYANFHYNDMQLFQSKKSKRLWRYFVIVLYAYPDQRNKDKMIKYAVINLSYMWSSVAINGGNVFTFGLRMAPIFNYNWIQIAERIGNISFYSSSYSDHCKKPYLAKCTE